ncbi:hypothetical protein Lal_00008597 [Lupinus albus]|nr:hypothetical protein Lal_00008597 [Lupinus albus]
MCPGGRVVAATSEEGRVVTNGMSQYSRAEFNANSGIVVDISPDRDYPGGPLAGIAYQRHWESLAYVAGGSNYKAPGQKLGDFLAGRPSTTFGDVTPSYQPGVHLTDLSQCLPDFVIESIREALPRSRIRSPRRGADRGGDAHIVPHPHPARGRLPEREHARSLSRRRGRGLCGRHSLGGGGRHPRGRSAGAGHDRAKRGGLTHHSLSQHPSRQRDTSGRILRFRIRLGGACRLVSTAQCIDFHILYTTKRLAVAKSALRYFYFALAHNS